MTTPADAEATPSPDSAPQTHENQRVDAFVDASFAFALTLLVIGGGSGPPRTIDELRDALWGIPAFAAGFALVAFLWAAHREFGRLSPRRDPLSVVLSLAIIFTVLIYVYPLRLLMSSFAAAVSGGRGAAPDLLNGWDDLRTLYVVYGVGYCLLAILYGLLFAHGLKVAVGLQASHVRRAKEWVWVWWIVGGCAILSIAVAAFGPIQAAPWLPGTIYCLIPVGIFARSRLDKRDRRPRVAAEPGAPISQAREA